MLLRNLWICHHYSIHMSFGRINQFLSCTRKLMNQIWTRPLNLKHLNKWAKHPFHCPLATPGAILTSLTTHRQRSFIICWIKTTSRMMMLCLDSITAFLSFDGHSYLQASLLSGLWEFVVVKSRDYLGLFLVYQSTCVQTRLRWKWLRLTFYAFTKTYAPNVLLQS